VKYYGTPCIEGVWISGKEIRCTSGGINVRIAKGILKIAKTRRQFRLGGYWITRRPNGGLGVGCTSFTKEDVKRARELLKNV
jgi:hypothetical protein